MGQPIHQFGIGYDGTQTVLQHPQQKWQGKKKQCAADTMQYGNKTGERQLDLMESEMFRAFLVHQNFPPILETDGRNATPFYMA